MKRETSAAAPPRAPAPRPRRREATYALVYGTKGTGKSTLAEQMYRARIRAGGSGVWIDLTGGRSHLGKTVQTAGEAYRLIRYARARGEAFSIVVTPGWNAELDPLWRVLYTVGDLLVVLDEADEYASSRSIDPNLHRLIGRGRNREIDVVATVQVPPDLHKKLEGMNDVVYTFRQPSRHYAEVLDREFFHLPAGGVEAITRLPDFHYLRVAAGRVSRGVVRL